MFSLILFAGLLASSQGRFLAEDEGSGVEPSSCSCKHEVKVLVDEVAALRTVISTNTLWIKDLEDKVSKVTKETKNGPCQKGWTWNEQERSCYKFVAEDFEWAEARARCQALGADMVRIGSQLEQDFLAKQIMQNSTLSPYDYWIGLTDDDIEGEFRWNETGELANFTAWDSRSPANKGDDSCVELRRKSNWLWNDNECDEDGGAICEIEMKDN